MTKKLSLIGYLAALVLILSTDAATALARGRQGVNRSGQAAAPLSRGEERPPGNRRDARLNASSGPQLGRGSRVPQRNQAQRRLMQQRLMQAIGLTEDQRGKMQEIRRSYDDELISAGRRVREARRALNRAIMSERFDESLIRQSAEDLAAAQADMIRLQARMRAQVRSVLTPEQVTRFKELERRLRRQQRGQKQVDRQMGMQERTPPQAQEPDLLSLILPES